MASKSGARSIVSATGHNIQHRRRRLKSARRASSFSQLPSFLHPLSFRASIPTKRIRFRGLGDKKSRNPLSSRASIPRAPKIVSQNDEIVKLLRADF